MGKPYALVCADTIEAIRSRPDIVGIDLLMTSPPYNIGKSYEQKTSMEAYVAWQREVLAAWLPRMSRTGHVCFQVGNFVDKGEILPLDFVFIPLLQEAGLKLRNRMIWTFGHGLHARTRFSGRHETVLWFSVSDDYHYDPAGRFNDPRCEITEFNDVWDIPNVKHNHPEKIPGHPCQFPVALVERVVLGLTRPGDLVADPFAGVASAGVGSLLHGRRFFGAERDAGYHAIGVDRLEQTIAGTIKYRPHDRPVERPRDPTPTPDAEEDEPLPSFAP